MQTSEVEVTLSQHFEILQNKKNIEATLNVCLAFNLIAIPYTILELGT